MKLQVEDIDVFYGSSHILRDVSIEVSSGEIVGLLGRNGAGKTTALKTIVGLLRPRQGRILLDRADVSTAPSYGRAKRGLGYVPQERLVFASLTVEENLRAAAGRGFAEWEWLYTLFPRLRERGQNRAATLSGGEQEMLAIARALVTKPAIVLMDEPSTGLMPSLLTTLARVLEELRDRGVGILLVEEKLPFALSLASRFYIMDSGRIIFAGSREELAAGDILAQLLGIRATNSGLAQPARQSAASLPPAPDRPPRAPRHETLGGGSNGRTD